MNGAFTTTQSCWLATGVLLFVVAIVLFQRGKTIPSLFVLTAGGLVLRLLMTNTDPFLYDWDEQYHALVAKNMIKDPFTPMLYAEPMLPVDTSDWSANHIWLHKPPFFLWIIAISIKIFGATPFAVKLPSILLSSLMIPAIYFMMKRISGERSAWIAALLMAAHSYSIQLVSGFRNTDHNDVIFSALILFTFWSWVKYTDTKHYRDAIITGVLIGCAVLVKWMPGILVFLPWGLWMLTKENRTQKKQWAHLLAAFISALIIVLPWYIHIHSEFPEEAAHEMNYNLLHFTIPIEGHDGPWYFHFDALRELLGWTLAIFTLPGLFLLATQDRKQPRGLYIVIAVVLFFVFYSLAKTKMPLFMLPLIPLLLAGVALITERGINFLGGRKILAGCLLGALAVFVIDPASIIVNHSNLSELGWYRDQVACDRKRSAWIAQECGEGKWVVFGYPDNARASHMFYTGQVAYSEVVPDATIHEIKGKGYKVAMIVDNAELQFAPHNGTLYKVIVLPDSLK